MDNFTCDGSDMFFNDTHCGAVKDRKYCWPATPRGQNISKACPVDHENGLIKGTAYRYCQLNGTWDSFGKVNSENGSTNYDDCMLSHLRDLHKMCDSFGEDVCTNISTINRTLEMIGLSISIISLLGSLFIFCRYRVLRNNRTKIHINLFIATLLQLVIRMIKYIDQNNSSKYKWIENNMYLNMAWSSILEYSKTAMFMWMFIEGLYLHNMITVTVFQEYSYIKWYFVMGWTVPALITLVWFVTMITLYCLGTAVISWKYYYFLPYYWILEGPRSVIIGVNLLFLLNIIRVLIVKLRESQASEIEQVRKAVRAAIFLLPLLGISNVLFWIDYASFAQAWKFGLWYFTSYTNCSFQGFFVAVLYCFLNGEVQTAIKNKIYLHMSLRNQDYVSCRNITIVSSMPDQGKFISAKGKIWLLSCCRHRTGDDLEIDFIEMKRRRNTTIIPLTIVVDNNTKIITSKSREAWPQISDQGSVNLALLDENNSQSST